VWCDAVLQRCADVTYGPALGDRCAPLHGAARVR
jgi:hypothetical protein